MCADKQKPPEAASHQPTEPDSEPRALYAARMEEIKLRHQLVKDITSDRLKVPGPESASIELACVQVRKILELIAFGSLIANKEKYAAAHANFATHWNAKKMLRHLAKIHPNFYPLPMVFAAQEQPGQHKLDEHPGPFLTREDFVFLYDCTSKVLHTRNPFTTDSPVIDFRLSIDEWMDRIAALLNVHVLMFVDSTDIWVVRMAGPGHGKVEVFPAAKQLKP